jgi:hypothetical protein
MVEFVGGAPQCLSDLMKNPLGDWQVEMDDTDVRTAFNTAWAKLEKYYNRTDRSRAYFGSVRMHTALNAAWFDQNWTEDDQLE